MGFQDLGVAFEQRRKLVELVGVIGAIECLEPAASNGGRLALRETEVAQRALELSNRGRPNLGLWWGRWL
jgi:hypothetical protein